MSEQYIISIDQSTQGTKALLFDESGSLIRRTDKSHEQIVNEKGWVSHDPAEIYHNTIEVVRRLVEESGIEKDKIAGLGISNQRETSLAWDKETGEPIGQAIVWQCARAADICERVESPGEGGADPPEDGDEPVALFPGFQDRLDLGKCRRREGEIRQRADLSWNHRQLADL